MIYDHLLPARFIDRPNRFIAHVDLDGHVHSVHVKNTGRCGELLVPGAKVMIQSVSNPARKTDFDLISVYHESNGWFNIDSQAPNAVVHEWLLKQHYDVIQPEYGHGDSRLDFRMEKDHEEWYLEVKGCTLNIGGCGYFPDAPSSRAAKHCHELISALTAGRHCAIAFVIAMNRINEVLPNDRTDPVFSAALRQAQKAGVEIWFFPCTVGPDRIEIKERILRSDIL